MRKQFYVRFCDPRSISKSKDHFYCNASTLTSAKSVARKIKRELDGYNIRVYDTLQDDENGCAKVVFTID